MRGNQEANCKFKLAMTKKHYLLSSKQDLTAYPFFWLVGFFPTATVSCFWVGGQVLLGGFGIVPQTNRLAAASGDPQPILPPGPAFLPFSFFGGSEVMLTSLGHKM